MDSTQKEFLVARIISGAVPISISSKTYFVKSPSRRARLDMFIFMDQVRDELAFEDLLSQDELDCFLLTNKIWSADLEEEIVTLEKNIEEFKVQIFQNVFKSRERGLARKGLQVSRERLSELLGVKHSFDYLTVEGVISMVKAQLNMYSSLYDGDELVFKGDFWDERGDLLNTAIEKYHTSLFKEFHYREVARTDPWRSYWGLSSKEAGLFGLSPFDYSDEQRILSTWSNLYDRIFDSPNCPGDDVIQDDDMLDGWMIVQRRNREEHLAKKQGEEGFQGNEKIRQSDEIYVVAQNMDDARKVDKLNDSVSKRLKTQRWQTINRTGVADERDLPDIKNKYAIAATKQIAHLMNQNKQ